MNRKKILIIIGIFAVICILPAIGAVVGASIVISTLRPPAEEKQPPEIAGQKVPDVIHKIDFAKRYDFHCRFSKSDDSIFRDCKVVGFTGSSTEKEEPSSSSSFSSGTRFRAALDRHLVLQLPDGRLAYLPPGAIEYFLEAAPKK